jgi:2-haloacid dehalogenase
MSGTEHFDALVLGSGQGGKPLAWHIAQAGRCTAVVKRHWVGGSFPNIACMPNKNEIWGRIGHLAHHAAHFGGDQPGYHRNGARTATQTRDGRARNCVPSREAQIDRRRVDHGEQARFIAPKTRKGESAMTDEVSSSVDRRKPLSGLDIGPIGGMAASPIGSAALADDKGTRIDALVPSVCVFDVNETLLDIEFLAPLFQRLFGDRKVLREWFGQLILYWEAITLSGAYATFFNLGQGVLKMLGSIHGVSITETDVDELRTRMLTMPAHADVAAGLKQLKDAGFRLVTCTNSPPDPQTSPLKHAGIDGWFERSFSVDRVRRFKPAPQVYHLVTEELNVAPAVICMVAAHVWDTIGAQSIGCAGVLIARPGNAPLPMPGLPQPQVVAPDLPGAATQMIRLWR